MKYLSKLLYLAMILTCLISIQEVSAQSNGDNSSINRFISKQSQVNKAVENKEVRKTTYADLNKDGRQDAVVLYTLESFRGNNNYKQFLAIFIKTRSGAFRNGANKIIGGKNNRSVTLHSVKNGKINIATLNYLPTDASCCPSKKETSQIIFSNSRLRETKIK